ncbi:MAG: restriction endonuclease [Candidatus Eisenbacteria bacterium]|nr:restriction endonuclease [Candidatus Eisenbacteria bacterium]
MPVPDYQSLMLPVLRAVNDGATHKSSEISAAVAEALGLSDDDLAELLPSGKQTTFFNRSNWAMTYLCQAGLLKRPKRGFYEITDRGRTALESGLDRLTVGYLSQYAEFQEFKTRTHTKRKAATGASTDAESESTPTEQIEEGYEALRGELGRALLEQVLSCSPAFFEQLVVDLLVAMGYGGSRADAGKAVGGTGDGGIDGVIKEDRLGLDEVCVQAKRLTGGTVSRDTVQAFAGSLEGRRARKGVFITTGQFSKHAADFVERIEKRIILIDGERLTELMMDYGIGVTDIATYTIKRLDTDYFEGGDL